MFSNIFSILLLTKGSIRMLDQKNVPLFRITHKKFNLTNICKVLGIVSQLKKSIVNYCAYCGCLTSIEKYNSSLSIPIPQAGGFRH
jgi:hypothetical protein